MKKKTTHQHGSALISGGPQKLDHVLVEAEALLELHLQGKVLLVQRIPLVQHLAGHVLQPVPDALVHLWRVKGLGFRF